MLHSNIKFENIVFSQDYISSDISLLKSNRLLMKVDPRKLFSNIFKF